MGGRPARFACHLAGKSLADRASRLANFGYLGHMWELYAVWALVPIFLIASYEGASWSLSAARLAGFAVVGIGAVGCVVAGCLADRLGRTTIAIWSLLTLGTIRLVPWLRDLAGWERALGALALGPLFGILSMWRLIALPPRGDAMASGRK